MQPEGRDCQTIQHSFFFKSATEKTKLEKVTIIFHLIHTHRQKANKSLLCIFFVTLHTLR